jgi:hypothetical protein
MAVDPVQLLVGFLVSSVGLTFFVYGRRNGRIPHIAAGLPLMVVPLFLPAAFSLVALVGMSLILWIGTRHFGL